MIFAPQHKYSFNMAGPLGTGTFQFGIHFVQYHIHSTQYRTYYNVITIYDLLTYYHLLLLVNCFPRGDKLN